MASESSTYRLGTHQSASYTGTAGTITDAIGSGINAVRVVCTTAAFVVIGKDPTATSDGVYMAANVPEIFIAREGEKVSAIQVASGGSVHVTELS